MSVERDHEMIEQARRNAAAVRARGEGSDAATLRMGASHDWRLPEDIFPGYRLTRELHRGGQGVVYLARQSSPQRDVAIKVLRGGFLGDRGERARFEREVQILGALRHPDIVTIHDSGTASGYFYYVMDYLEGRRLDQWIAESTSTAGYRSGTSSQREFKSQVLPILALFARVCDAVNAAHLRGVIHRDLKPGNILIDSAGQPHILDFGLARQTGQAEHNSSDAVTHTGQFVGSPPWASPEQAEGRLAALDLRTDVYSIGIMLYQALTGQFPYSIKGPLRDVLKNVAQVEPTPPSAHVRRLDRDVETIVLKCLAKDPLRRYQSAGELARDIRHHLAGEPIDARRDSATYVLRKTLRRYRWPLSAAAVAGALVTGAAIMMSVLYSRQLAESRRADREARAALAAQQRAERLADESGALLHQARDAVEFLTEQVSTELEPLFGTAEVRREILKRAFERLSDLARNRSDLPELQIELAHIHARLAGVAVELEDAEQIRVHREAARQILAKLLQESPDDKDAGLLLGQLQLTEADEALARGDLDTARRDFETILAAYERIQAANPDDPDAVRKLSLAYERMAMLGRASNDRAADEQWTQRMQALKLRAAELAPDNPLYRYELSIAEERLAENARRARDADAAEKHARAALEIREELVNRDPPDRRHLRALSISYEQLANTTMMRGDHAGELSWVRKMLEIKRRLVAREPSNRLYQHDLAICLDRLGTIERRQGDAAEALRLHTQAIEIFRRLIDADPDLTRYRTDLIGSLQQAGAAAYTCGDSAAFFARLNESLEAAELLRRMRPDDRDAKLHLAASHHALGLALIDAGPADQARMHFETALELCDAVLAVNPGDRGASKRSSDIRRSLAELTRKSAPE